MKNIVTYLLGAFCAVAISSEVNGQATIKAKPVLLADNGVSKKKTIVYETKEATVVFPKLLQGNEEQAAEYIESFAAKRRDYVLRMFKKSRKHASKIQKTFSKFQLPAEFQVLMAIESAYNGNAVSRSGAVGYWQIMDMVAQEYGMQYEKQLTAEEKLKLETEKKKLEAEKKRQEALLLAAGKTIEAPKATEKPKPVVDDRRNFAKSTLVAAKYLKDRYKNLGNNILLVCASYNCGVGNVWNAMRKSGVTNPTFWDIKKHLPMETQNYVMNFITLNVLFSNIKKFETNTLTYKPTQVAVVKEVMEENTSEKEELE
jgi:membrane-bound lytic murein transglycosylase D